MGVAEAKTTTHSKFKTWTLKTQAKSLLLIVLALHASSTQTPCYMSVSTSSYTPCYMSVSIPTPTQPPWYISVFTCTPLYDTCLTSTPHHNTCLCPHPPNALRPMFVSTSIPHTIIHAYLVIYFQPHTILHVYIHPIHYNTHLYPHQSHTPIYLPVFSNVQPTTCHAACLYLHPTPIPWYVCIYIHPHTMVHVYVHIQPMHCNTCLCPYPTHTPWYMSVSTSTPLYMSVSTSIRTP